MNPVGGARGTGPTGTGPTGTGPTGTGPTEIERLRRRVLWTMPTGLYLVGSRQGPRVNLMTANWVMQVATAPVLVAAAVERTSVTASLVAGSGAFSVSILRRDDRAVVRRFVKPVVEVERDGDGALVALQGEPVREVGGLPVLAGALAWLRCEVRHELRWEGEGSSAVAPSHLLFVGEVAEAGFDPGSPEGEGAPLRMEDTRMHYGG